MKPFSCLVKPTNDSKLDQQYKVNLPEKILQDLLEQDCSFPYIFKITNEEENKKLFVSVMMFTTEDDQIEIPHMICNDFSLWENSRVNVEFIPDIIKAKAVSLACYQSIFEKENYEDFLQTKLSEVSCLFVHQVFYFEDDAGNTFRVKVESVEPDWETLNFTQFHETNQNVFLITDCDIDTNLIQISTSNKKRKLPKDNEAPKEKEKETDTKSTDSHVGEQEDRTKLSTPQIRNARLSYYERKKKND